MQPSPFYVPRLVRGIHLIYKDSLDPELVAGEHKPMNIPVFLLDFRKIVKKKPL